MILKRQKNCKIEAEKIQNQIEQKLHDSKEQDSISLIKNST